MSIFKNIFGNSENETPKESKINWIHLTDLGQLNEVQEVSYTKATIIFKHSTTCSISRMALKNFENEYELNDFVDAYFLDLLNQRDICSEIATKFNVVHQSPQLLLIKNGECVYNDSHDRIDAAVLRGKI